MGDSGHCRQLAGHLLFDPQFASAAEKISISVFPPCSLDLERLSDSVCLSCLIPYRTRGDGFLADIRQVGVLLALVPYPFCHMGAVLPGRLPDGCAGSACRKWRMDPINIPGILCMSVT